MNRAAVMKRAHRLFRARQRDAAQYSEPCLAISWGEALQRAWAMERQRMDASRRADDLRKRALSLYGAARAIYEEGIWRDSVCRRYKAKYVEAYRLDMNHNDARAEAMRLGQIGQGVEGVNYADVF